MTLPKIYIVPDMCLIMCLITRTCLFLIALMVLNFEILPSFSVDVAGYGNNCYNLRFFCNFTRNSRSSGCLPPFGGAK